MTRPPTIHNRKKSPKTPAILGASVFTAAIAISIVLYIFKPEAKQQGPDTAATAVRVLKVSPDSFQPTIPSQGILEPLTRTTATSEVSGKVVEVFPNFYPGQLFTKGGTLLQIDSSDYDAALATAEANLAQARLNLETEKARAVQAKKDWDKLSPGRAASPLTLRGPQLESASKQVTSAEAAVAKAARDVKRTSLVAPYDGRIVSTSTDEGSYVTTGSPLAEFYATDVLEVRLPVSVTDFTFLNMEGTPDATLVVGAGTGKERWPAKIVRSEGEIDRASRSAYIVAQIDIQEALEKSDGSVHPGLLTPGLFVEAELPGATLEGVYRVPRKALVEGGRVLVVDKDDKIRFQNVSVLRLDGKTDMILSADSLKPGDRVCLTPLESATVGMPVRVLEEIPPGEQTPPPPSKEIAQP
ncbi:MAG: efflux RND transporter periplasmic adaptor subunit [Verrucomicrobiota bacterium]